MDTEETRTVNWELTPAVEAKLIAMLAIGLGSFIVGVTPACFITRAKELHQTFLLSCTLCFGGGVLFATSLLHMLPEVRLTLPRYAELVFSCGYLLLYMIDELVHYFCGNKDNTPVSAERSTIEQTWINSMDRRIHHKHHGNIPNLRSHNGNRSLPNIVTPFEFPQTSYGSMQLKNPKIYELDTTLTHVSSPETSTGTAGLLLALTIHAILEGLSIGLQNKTAEVVLLVVAVASHKFVVGFCLGLELAGAGSSCLKLITAMFVFSGGSSVGIGIGMLSYRVNGHWSALILPILQGLAGGTLLYVTVSEVLPRERTRWHKNVRYRSAGILQFVSSILGFVVIFLINQYVAS